MFIRCSAILACLLLSFSAAAQGFDPGTVDWDKLSKIPMKDMFIKQFNKNCAACHGEDLRGAPLGTPLVGNELRHGDSVKEIANSIATGFAKSGMPAWSETLSEDKIWNLALYIAEKRQGTTILDKRADMKVLLPEGTVETAQASFTIEQVVTGLDPMPFSIALLPDGRILLSERMVGLSIIDGGKKIPVEGTPPAYNDSNMFLGQVQGLGWSLEVALHPDYDDNGWIYLHHTDRCTDCNDMSKRGGQPVSMNRIVRGRLKGNQWIDQEVIWEADKAFYTTTSDLAAGGRLTFDDDNYVYFGVAMKDTLDVMGIQDLSKPYGKIHRVHDDGSIPKDNPFVDTPDAIASTWSYGHRSVQGLEYYDGYIWNTEMGPRGGDELNRVVKGGNYGWPIVTTGVNYDGRPVKVPKSVKRVPEEDTVLPVADWTPAIAISSFVFYEGEAFPEWQGQIIAGTLRATDLLRLKVSDTDVEESEVLLEDLARFRDIEIGDNGELYILLENKTDSQIIRLIPAE